MRNPDPPDCVDVPCVDCGRPVTIYPPEDGHDPAWRCGRCAHTPMAVRATDAATPTAAPSRKCGP